MILDLILERDPTCLQLSHRVLDTITVERQVVRPSRCFSLIIDRMNAQIGFWEIEYQPAIANIRTGKFQLVTNEGTCSFRLRTIEQSMKSPNHALSVSSLLLLTSYLICVGDRYRRFYDLLLQQPSFLFWQAHMSEGEPEVGYCSDIQCCAQIERQREKSQSHEVSTDECAERVRQSPQRGGDGGGR